jgi:hypothetical protein
MAENGSQPWVIADTTDESALHTLAQRTMDEQTGVLAAVKPEHAKFFDGHMADLDRLEADTLGEIARVKQKVRPEYQQAEVQQLGDQALANIPDYIRKHVVRLKGELAALQDSRPKPPKLSEVQANTHMMKTLYILNQLQGAPAVRLDGQREPANLFDGLHLQVLFSEALEKEKVAVIQAILDDPLERHRDVLTPEQRERAQGVLGLDAWPELKAQIGAYAAMVRRYEDRFARMRRRFQGEGWSAGDALADIARGGAAMRSTPTQE